MEDFRLEYQRFLQTKQSPEVDEQQINLLECVSTLVLQAKADLNKDEHLSYRQKLLQQAQSFNTIPYIVPTGKPNSTEVLIKLTAQCHQYKDNLRDLVAPKYRLKINQQKPPQNRSRSPIKHEQLTMKVKEIRQIEITPQKLQKVSNLYPNYQFQQR